ncbi:MAG TPA: ATP-binding protein [Gemmataceae bacterium]|nr:ATP-binding protein [Gemmataceae bacterium]
MHPHPAPDRVPAERLADILDIAEDGVVTVNLKREIVLYNRGAAKIFGYAPEEILGRSLEELLPAAYRATHPGQVEAFARGPVVSRIMGERRVVAGRRKDGTEFPAEVSISKLERGGETLLTAIVRDGTVRKKYEDAILQLNEDLERRIQSRTAELAERNLELEAALTDLRAKTDELRSTTQQLWQAARLAGVGELAASIAHELNNPMATVHLRLEGVLARTPADDPRRRPLEVVEQEVERMAQLVANLLHFSRAGRGQVSTVNVPDEVRKTIDLTGPHLRRLGVVVEPEFHPVPDIYADRQQLRQVFLNLFTNAADAMPKGGRLSPRVRPGLLPPDRPAVAIEVTDSGTGIPAEVLPRVFDPFFTTKEEGKGTGLGLVICKRIVQEHHGTLEIESEVGRGTTVRVTLPVKNGTNVDGLR